MTPEEIKRYVDQIVVESDVNKQFNKLESLIGMLVPYMLQGYKECREVTQVAIGQLERIPSVCVLFFFLNIREFLKHVSAENTRPPYLDYINADWDGYTKDLLDKVAPHIAGEHRSFDLHPEIADVLTYEQRRILASAITDVIQGYGVKTQWNEDEFQNAVFFCNILYPICKKDGIMDLLFHAYGNVIDRLNTSGYSQHARDLAEGLLIIGYNEAMEAEAYFAACRAYTGANNVIGGLLFYYISLLKIDRNGKKVTSRFAFDLYWQYPKICRVHGIYPADDMERVTEAFEKTVPNQYDRMSFYHTKFSTRLMAKGERTLKLVEDVTEFLGSSDKCVVFVM